MTDHTNTEAPKPVEDWENEKAKGLARASKSIFDDQMKFVESLRGQQEAYESSLPDDPLLALEHINRALPDMKEVDEPHYAPRAALEIIMQLAANSAMDDSPQMKNAIFWLTMNGLRGLAEVDKRVDHAKSMAFKHVSSQGGFKA